MPSSILVLLFALGIHREPTLLYTLSLLKEFQNAPEARATHHAQHGAEDRMLHQKAGNNEPHAAKRKEPPALGAKIVLALNNNRVKESNYKKRNNSNYQSRIIHSHNS